jgi:transcriptional regulator with XRE-family HTH domain
MQSMNTGNGTQESGSIRAGRRSAGLSQAQLADRVGCSTDYIRLLERGYMPRFSDVLPRVLEVLEAAAAS